MPTPAILSRNEARALNAIAAADMDRFPAYAATAPREDLSILRNLFEGYLRQGAPTLRGPNGFQIDLATAHATIEAELARR
jgi:hypothetical protein